MNRLLIGLSCCGLLMACARTQAIEEYVEGRVPRKVVKLTKANFKAALKDPVNPVMLIMFGAYWCGHCKRLSPILDMIAPQAAGRVLVGKVDCTEEKKLCDKYKIRGYPTLKFSLDGEVFDYTLGRREEDFLGFADKMSRPPLVVLQSAEQIIQAREDAFDHGVSFVCHDSSASDRNLDEMLETSRFIRVCAQAARKNMAFAHFAALKSTSDVSSIVGGKTPTVQVTLAREQEGMQEATKISFVCRLERDVPPRCLHEGDEPIDVDSVMDFVRLNNVASFVNFGPENFHRLGRLGRLLVIGVAKSNEDEQIEKFGSDMRKFAARDPPQLASKYYFGWMDGTKWNKFLKQFDIDAEDLPQVLVLDVPKRLYWHDPAYNDRSLKEFLGAIEDGELQPKKSGGVRGAGFLARMLNGFFQGMPWSLIFLLGVAAVVALAIVPDAKEVKPPFDQTGSKRGAPHQTQAFDILLGKKTA